MKSAKATLETKSVTIRLAVGDITRVKKLAETKGIGYQTLIRMLLHESLWRDSRD